MVWTLAIVAAFLVILWLLGERRTQRPDGTLVKVHPYRRLMQFIMPRRNHSMVFFDALVDAEQLQAWIEQAHPRFGAHVTHALVAAGAIGLHENPRMNRFVAGRRLYQRDGIWITFSMKRKKLDRRAKLATVKLPINEGETVEDLCGRIDGVIAEQRSGRQTGTDREYALFNALPRPALAVAVRFLRLLDHYGLLPGFFIEGDGMYASLFIANLGSLDMGVGYHHLYEWGNCPLFMMVGRIEERPLVRDGEIVARPVLPIRFTYDERIDDGLNARFGIEAVRRVLEHPFEELGCVADDGSDRHVLLPEASSAD